VEAQSSLKIDDIAKRMPANQPRYILHKFSHENDKKELAVLTLFIYFCPENAHPRLKMTYSMLKAHAVRACEKLGVEPGKQYECTEASTELTVAAILAQLYVRVAERKVIARPKPAGKGGRRLVGGTKFDAKSN